MGESRCNAACRYLSKTGHQSLLSISTVKRLTLETHRTVNGNFPTGCRPSQTCGIRREPAVQFNA